MKVIFEAVLINEQRKKKFLGLVSNSRIKVYYSLYNQNIINTIHVHVNDTNEAISVDAFYLEKEEKEIDYKNFSKDLKGKKLDYKFLFKNYKLTKIFYAMSEDFIDEPEFDEVKICIGKIIRIQANSKYDGYYAKIKSIPLGMLTRRKNDDTDIEKDNQLKLDKKISNIYPAESFCSDRSMDLKIHGHIDLEVVCNNKSELLSQNLYVSVPVCQLTFISEKEEVSIEKLLLQSLNIKSKDTLQEFNDIFAKYISFEKYLSDNSAEHFNQLTQEGAKEILSFFDVEINEKALTKYLENDEYAEVNFFF